MKLFKTLFLLFLIIFLLTSCTHTKRGGMIAKPGSAFQKIQQRGRLVVGTSANQPLLTLEATDGEVIGFEADMAALMAEAMGVKLRMATLPFSDLLPALEAGKVDMILSGMTITADRNLTVAFVGPYLVSGKGLLTRDETIASLEDSSLLDDPKRTLAALRGSTSQAFVQKNMPRAGLVLTADYDEVVSLLLQGKVDAFIADFPICAVSVLRYPDKGLIPLIAPLTYEPLGIALPPDDPLLVNWVQNFLGFLEGSGRMEELEKRWFKETDWLERLP